MYCVLGLGDVRLELRCFVLKTMLGIKRRTKGFIYLRLRVRISTFAMEHFRVD